MIRWPSYLPAGILLTGAVVSAVAGTPHPTPLAKPLRTTLPLEFLGKRAVDIPIDADEAKASGVSDYSHRGFDVGGWGLVTLYVGYHATQQGENRMHSPTLCLPGSGWTPVDSRLMSVPVGAQRFSVNRYVLQKGGQQILVYYWFQGRGRVTSGETQLKLNAFKDAFLKHRDEEALVRITVPVGQAAWTAAVGTTGLPPDSIAVRLTAITIPSVEQALPTAP